MMMMMTTALHKLSKSFVFHLLTFKAHALVVGMYDLNLTFNGTSSVIINFKCNKLLLEKLYIVKFDIFSLVMTVNKSYYLRIVA